MNALPSAYPTFWGSILHSPLFIVCAIIAVAAVIVTVIHWNRRSTIMEFSALVCIVALLVMLIGPPMIAPAADLNTVVRDAAAAKYHVTSMWLPTMSTYTSVVVSGRTNAVAFDDCYLDLGATPADLVIQCPKAGTSELVDLNALTDETTLEDLGKGHDKN